MVIAVIVHFIIIIITISPVITNFKEKKLFKS